jgi:hypothetical protein
MKLTSAAGTRIAMGYKQLKGTGGQMAVIGIIERKGNMVCKMIENPDTATLNGFVRKAVSERIELVVTVVTDECPGYQLQGIHTGRIRMKSKRMRSNIKLCSLF